MWNSFKISYQLKNTYRVNTILHIIKNTPFLKKIIRDDVYSNMGFKLFGIIVSFLHSIFSLFFGKLLYILFFIFLPSLLNSGIFLNAFFFLTLVGALINSFVFDITKDKYYAFVLLKMDARLYTVSNYIYFLLSIFIGFFPFCLLFGIIADIPVYACFLLPAFIVSAKTIFSAFQLYLFKKKKFLYDKNHLGKSIICLILILFAYGLPFLSLEISFSAFFFLGVLFIIIGCFSFLYIWKYDAYLKLYKTILTDSSIIFSMESIKDMQKQQINGLIDIKGQFTSEKEGCAYFNELFVKRHNKILFSFSKKLSFITIALFFIILIFLYFVSDIKEVVNKNIVGIVPTLTILMYYLNSGQRIAQVYFLNCDCAMLSYSFYKQPRAILDMFKERLKSIIIMNLIPSLVISFCLCLLLYFSGGAEHHSDYVLLLLAINSMSMFFSIHHLVIYYLLQPYNKESDIKNFTYQFVNVFTYFVCYFLMNLKIPLIVFSLTFALFCLVYSAVSLFLVYQFSTKTFRIHL